MWRWDQQEPFGSNPADENPSGLGTFEFPIRLSRGYADKETGKVYSYFRDSSPDEGRFVQGDPIGLRGGENLYLFVSADPLRSTDVFGLADSSGFSTRYGNWCGKDYSGGRVGRLIPANPAGPIDSVDECCMTHDYCYARFECVGRCMSDGDRKVGKFACDEEMFKCLDSLRGKAPQNWPKPPKSGTEAEAYFYCQKAKWWSKN